MVVSRSHRATRLGLAIGILAVASLLVVSMATSSIARGPSERLPAAHQAAQVSLTISSAPAMGGWYEIPLHGPAPGNRTGAQMAYDSEDGYVLLFGGCPSYVLLGGCGSRSLGDTWTYRGGAWTELHLPVSPSNRSGGGLVDDPSFGGVLLFGGSGPNGTLNDTWSFSHGAWTKVPVTAEPPRTAYAGMAYDARDAKIVLYGAGGSTSTGTSQTWTFSSGTWANVTRSIAPPALFDPFLHASPLPGEVVLEGGASATFFPTYYSVTWTFDGSTDRWANVTGQVTASNPGTRVADPGAFDPALNETFLFGGGHGAGIDKDLWGYGANGSWSAFPTAHQPPGAFYDTQGSWDGFDGYVVAFCTVSLGSFYGITTIAGVTNGTWALTTAVLPSLHGAANITTGASLDFQGNASGGLPPYAYNWSIDGTVVNDSPSFTRAFTSAGSYTVTLTVTDSLGQSRSASTRFNVSSAPLGGGLGSFPSKAIVGGISLLDLLLVVAVVVVAAVVGIAASRRRSRRAGGAPESPPAPGGENTGEDAPLDGSYGAPADPAVEGAEASPPFSGIG